jgi:hypothetical protein
MAILPTRSQETSLKQQDEFDLYGWEVGSGYTRETSIGTAWTKTVLLQEAHAYSR